MITEQEKVRKIATWTQFVIIAACAAWIVTSINMNPEQYTFLEMVLFLLFFLVLFCNILDTWWYERIMPKDSDVYVTEKTLKTAIELGTQDSADGIVLHMDNTDWVLLRNTKNPNRNDNDPAKLVHFSVGI